MKVVFPSRSRRARAFTLIEVVLSIGVFSFAMLSIVGLVSTGLSTIKTSSTNQAVTNINRNLRANLQATSYTNLASGVATTYYYTDSGYQTTSSSTAPSAPFYQVVVTPTASQYPLGVTVTAKLYSISMAAVISYPYQASAANRQSITNSYFIAQ